MIQTLSDLRTVRFNEQADGVVILDQTLLPGKEAYLTLTTAEEIWDAIYKLKVRGAPAIGVAAAYGIYVCARRVDTAEKSVFVGVSLPPLIPRTTPRHRVVSLYCSSQSKISFNLVSIFQPSIHRRQILPR